MVWIQQNRLNALAELNPSGKKLSGVDNAFNRAIENI